MTFKFCQECGTDISYKPGRARYCDECSGGGTETISGKITSKQKAQLMDIISRKFPGQARGNIVTRLVVKFIQTDGRILSIKGSVHCGRIMRGESVAFELTKTEQLRLKEVKRVEVFIGEEFKEKGEQSPQETQVVEAGDVGAEA
jgi:hypothetical protein